MLQHLIFASLMSTGQVPGFTAQLPTGSRAVLVAVSKPATKASWTPRGIRQTPWVYPKILTNWKDILGDNPQNVRVITLRMTRRRKDDYPSAVFSINNGPIVNASFTALEDKAKPWFWWIGMLKDVKSGEKTSDVKVGLSDDEWQVRGQVRAGARASATGIGFNPQIANVTNAVNPFFEVKVTLPAALLRDAVRVKAYDQKGKAMPSGGSTTKPGAAEQFYSFKGTSKTLGTLQLETRKYHWTTFKQVRLEPR